MRYDVAVVGAGPAGATAAKFLSEAGLCTLLLEKATFPRDKPCGGGLQMRVLHRFKYLEEHSLIDSFSTRIQIHSSSLLHPLDFHHTKPLEAMVLRQTFDEGLVTLATRTGALLQCGNAVQDLTNQKDHIRLVLSNGTTVESRLVIGADGMWSTIAKKIGMKQHCDHIGICAYNEYHLDQETMRDLYGEERSVHIHVQPYGLAGYGWVFPKKEHVNIGIVEFRQAVTPRINKKKNLQILFTQYLEILKKKKLIPNSLSTTTTHGGVFPTCPMSTLTADRVLLCGDAGGLANPMTGEGIYYAMCSAETAAKTAIKALENSTTDVRSLKCYQTQWNQEFSLELSLLSRLSKRWGRNLDSFLEVANKDPKLVDIICQAIPSPKGVQGEKWKIIRRFVFSYCTHKLRR
ncbi:MAG: NAD(P)/FAD-dependent oxidoreductase [Candidatus Thermoplasmatota archaeon]|nr:NAD(P)/FAD-dependent oxidoreductase [Candidatus Thermoplasmatota archaeon]